MNREWSKEKVIMYLERFMLPYIDICEQRVRHGENIESNQREIDDGNDILEYLKINLK